MSFRYISLVRNSTDKINVDTATYFIDYLIICLLCFLSAFDDAELVVMGSTRHNEDIVLLESLKAEVERLNLQHNVRFIANGAYSELQTYMKKASIGIHTMWNEHFGISVVEMMAAGLIVVAHNSGGPKMDIIPHPSGSRSLICGKYNK